MSSGSVRLEKEIVQNELQARVEPPDYQSVRDRTLKKLKVGSQSSIGKAIDAFIKELLR